MQAVKIKKKGGLVNVLIFRNEIQKERCKKMNKEEKGTQSCMCITRKDQD